MTPTPSPDTLALAVRRAVDDSVADLARMPFFARPFVRAGFARRTGMDAEEWTVRLASVRAGDTPASVRVRWPDAAEVLGKLADHFRTAPERAARGMNDPAALRRVTEQSKMRADAVDALIAWLRS